MDEKSIQPRAKKYNIIHTFWQKFRWKLILKSWKLLLKIFNILLLFFLYYIIILKLILFLILLLVHIIPARNSTTTCKEINILCEHIEIV